MIIFIFNLLLFYVSFRAIIFFCDGLVCLKQDIKSEMNSMMNPITARPDGTLIGVQGIDLNCPLIELRSLFLFFHFVMLLCGSMHLQMYGSNPF